MFDLFEKLKTIKQKNLFRNAYEFSTPQETQVNINNKSMMLFSSNNYLGFSNDYSLKENAIELKILELVQEALG